MSDNQPSDYAKDAIEQQARWKREFAAARKALEPWQTKAEDIDKEFRNEKPSSGDFDTRLPLFTSDVQTLHAMLYGKVPKADVSRRFGDADDDVGRVAGEILERILNTDIPRPTDTFASTVGNNLMDFLLPGFANARWRYVTGEIVSEPVLDANGQPVLDETTGEPIVSETRPNEDVECDYVHWKSWLWGPAKVPQDVPWWSVEVEMTRDDLVRRFGELGKLVPLTKDSQGNEDPWSRAKVHEIHERATKCVYWFCESFTQILDKKEDPLKLEGFYPFPAKPLIANLTTSKVVPRPYFALHQDQYKQINVLMTRIRELVETVKAAGVCNKEDWEVLQRLFNETGRNTLLPMTNFAAFAERGGINGAVSWFPLEMFVQAITLLQQQLASEIDLLHQATGWSDIMRGEATQAGATATEQRAKARAGSVRVRKIETDIAAYASDLLRIKAEIVCKHFSPDTIKARANVQKMPQEDQALADDAIALLQSEWSAYRVEVKAEALAMADFSAMKEERTEFMLALAEFFTAVAPMSQAVPDSQEGFIGLAKWMVSGIRGSSQAEGIFDGMITKAKAAAEAAKQAKAAGQTPPDPKAQAEQMKQQTMVMQGQQKMALEQQKAQLQAQQTMNEVQADKMRESNQREENVREAFQRAQISDAFRPPQVPTTVRPNKPRGPA